MNRILKRLLRRKKIQRILIVGLISLGVYIGNFITGEESISTTDLEQDVVTLSRCVDGDTAVFIIEGVETTVRFLAIDTPETVHPTVGEEEGGKVASEYTCELLSNADVLYLEYEEGNKTDVYDRTLAWIFIDDELIQEKLVREGYGEVAYIYGDYKYTDLLYEAQDNAKANEYGIWGN